MINATPVQPLSSTQPTGPTTSPMSSSFTPAPKKKFSLKMILGLIVFLIVAVGGVAGFYLSQTTQDNRQQASVGSSCGSGAGVCQMGTSCSSGYQVVSGGICSGGPPQTCCKPTPPPDCPAGSTPQNAIQCKCTDGTLINRNGIAKCPTPKETCLDVLTNMCTTATSCPTGYRNGSGSCNNGKKCCEKTPVQNLVCPDGSVPNGPDTCKCNSGGAIVQTGGSCPETCLNVGTNMCTTAGSCPSGYANDSGFCRNNKKCCKKVTTLPNCPSGSSVESDTTCRCAGGVIIARNGSAKCPVPAETCLNVATNMCTTASSCPAGYENGAGSCNNSKKCCKKVTTAETCLDILTNMCTTASSCPAGYRPGTGNCNNKKCCEKIPTGLVCPANSVPSGPDVCKCNYGGLVFQPPGTTPCPTGPTIPRCLSVAGNQCKSFSCGTGFVGTPGTCPSADEACCKPTGTCPAGTKLIPSGPNAGQCQCSDADGGKVIPPGGKCSGGPVTPGNLCPNPPNLPAVKYLRYTCPNGCTQGEGGFYHCYENPEFFDNPVALKNSNDCGQVDVLSSTSTTSYCGYLVNTCLEPRCQTKPTTPPTTPTPVVGPMCMSITMKIADVVPAAGVAPKIGDSISFTCGKVPNVDHYRFRIVLPDGTRIPLTATGRNSEAYVINSTGTFTAQCGICLSAEPGTCQSFEKLPAN